MKRLLLIAAAVLALIVVAGALVLPSLLDVERHRPAIVSAIASATGRAVVLGPLRLRVFPVPELTADGLTIGEDPRFGSAPFLETKRVEIRVRLLPLLGRRISVVSLTIDHPVVRLRRDREGRWNVLSFGPAAVAPAGGTPSPGSPVPVAAPAPPAPAAAPGEGLSLSADRIELRGGTLTLVDEASGTDRPLQAEVANLDCTVTDLSLASAIGLDLAFDAVGLGRMGLRGKLGPLSSEDDGTLPVDLTLGLSGTTARLAGKLTGLRARPGIDARLVASKVSLQELAPVLRLLGPLVPRGLARKGEIAVDASARGPLDDPSRMTIEGTATLRDLELADASLAKPITGIHGSLLLRGDRAEISDFGAALGGSSVTGACSVTRFERPVIDVRLDSPLIDVDELLSLLAASGAPAASESKGPPAPAAPVGASKDAAPVAAAPATPSVLPSVTIRGELAIAKAKVMNLQLANAKATLAMENGTARLSGISVDLYGGRMTGEVTADVAKPGPPYSLAARIERVRFDALAADLSKDLAGLLYGTLETSLEVRGRGLDAAALRRSLAGRGSLALRDGKLTSVSVLGTVSKALQALGGRGIGEQETPFRSLTGSFTIADGRAVTEDLALDSADLVLAGKGSVDLDLKLDLAVAAKFSPEVSADMVARTGTLRYLEDASGRIELNLTARGSLDSPALGVDRDMLERAARAATKSKVQEKGKSLLQKLLEKKKN